MEDYGLLAILVFLIFLLTVGLIITKKLHKTKKIISKIMQAQLQFQDLFIKKQELI